MFQFSEYDTKPKFPELSLVDVHKIRVLTSAPLYHPKTNITNQDKYKRDSRLYNQETRYTDKDATLVYQQLKGIFNTALFFGHDICILDDRGVDDFWHPLHHLAEITARVINEYRNQFKEIVIAIPNPFIYEVFKKYIR